MARWLGIDITASVVRVALLSSGFRKTTLIALREERLTEHETPSAALRAATQGLRADACATAVDGRKSFMRRLDLPRAAQKDLANVLSFEVEATLPFELDDAVMDHRRLKPIPGVDAPEQLPIFAGVTFIDEVRERLGLVRRGFGVDPARVGLGPLALANLAQLAPELARTTPVAILELGEDAAEVVVLRNGEPRFARTLSRGVVGLPASAPALARELRQTLAAWRAGGGDPLTSLLVVGPGRHTPGLEAFMQGELGIEVVDLPALELDGLGGEDRERLPRYAKAIALAMSLSRRASDLNMRQGPLEAQQSYQFLREKTPLLAGLATAVMVSFGFSMFAEMRSLEAERKILEEQLYLATRAHFGKATRDPREAASLFDGALAGKSEDPMPAMDGFDVIAAISERIPKELVHDVDDFDFNRGIVNLKGLVGSIDDAETVAAKIGEHECFKDVNLSRTTMLKERSKYKYTLDFKVDCAAKPKAKPGAKAPAKGGSK